MPENIETFSMQLVLLVDTLCQSLLSDVLFFLGIDYGTEIAVSACEQQQLSLLTIANILVSCSS